MSTLEQDAWVALVFEVDPANCPSVPNGGTTGAAPNAAPPPSLYADVGTSSKPPSQGPAPPPPPTSAPAQDTTPSCWITVTNNTKSVLKLAHQGHDIGDFESFPAATLQPGSATSFVSTQTPHAKSDKQGCKGFVEWTVESADGKGGTAATWRVTWNNPLGEKNTAEATITPAKAAFSSLEQIGQGDVHVPVVFTLSAGVGAAAQPTTPDPHDVEITIQNATDATLLLAQEYLDRVSTQSLIPASIAPGQTVKLAVIVPYLTSTALVYSLVPPGVTKAPDDAPSWEVHWYVDVANKFIAQPHDPSAPWLTAEANSDGVGKATFKLSGKLPVAASAQPVGISITNSTDQILRLVSTNTDGGQFDPAPPNEIAPGAKVTLAAKGTGPKGGILVYRVEPAEGIINKPDQLASWTLSWTHPAGQQPLADATFDPDRKGWSSAAIAGKTGVAYVLTGTTAAAPPAPGQRIDISISNRTDQALLLLSAKSDAGEFDPAPPRELAAGATVSIAMVGTDLKGASLEYMFNLQPRSTFSGENVRRWTLLWSLSADQKPVPSATFDPSVKGVTSTAAKVGDSGVAFTLSGTTPAAAPAPPPTQPQTPVVDQRTHVTFVNKSNMLLRLEHNDRTAAQWETMPPKEIQPGGTGKATTVTRGEVDADLWYELIPTDGSPPKATNSAVWIGHWWAIPGGKPTASTQITAVMPGLVADYWIGTDDVTFQLSGDWSPVPREFKTGVSVTNETKFTLRLATSEASAARFDPPAPKEIAPGAMVFFATWAKEKSHQELVYEFGPQDGPPDSKTKGKGKTKAKPWVWTITWHTQPGTSATSTATTDGPAGLQYGMDGPDDVAFKLSASDDADKK